jgi:hypothetical protein
MNSIAELMALYGYNYTGTCWCDGYKTRKYRSGAFEFRWRVTRYQFRLRDRGLTIKAWTAVKEAEEYLKTLHAAKDQTVPED